MAIMERPEEQHNDLTNGTHEKENGEGVAPAYLQEGVPPQQILPTDLNGASSLPPQQVFVNTPLDMPPQNGMSGLETQFMAMGMNGNGEHHGEQNGDVDQSGADNNDDEQEAHSEDDPVKLFVGQIPKSLNEEDIFPTFSPFGPLKDVAIIRDKHTGLHRGCAFVTFWTSADAEIAQEALHNKFTFPGGRRPAQVKPAEPSVPENKLFIGMLSRAATEDDVRELFEPFGEIREIYMIRNADGSSRCAAFLRYVQREAALDAIQNLHSNVVMEGSTRPLIVKFADNRQQRQQRHNRNNMRREQMMAMGPPGGPGYSPYQMPQVPPQMGMPHGPPGHQYSMPPQYPGPYGGGGPPPPHHAPHPYMYPPHFAPPYAYQNQNRPNMQGPANPRPREGPAGANLFVYHLPHDLTDADLATAFNPFGNVISAKVYVDKFSGESKGFGFVSYDSVMAAEAAIEQMNGFQIGNKRLKVQHKRVSSHRQQQQHQPHQGNHQGNGYESP